MNKYILGIGHHPFSKKKEFRGFFDDVVPCLIATDYKAPKCVLELHVEEADMYSINNGQMEEMKSMKNKKEYKQKPFKYVSLFSGIGAFEKSLNKFGGECVMASEIDKFAEKAYQTLYGHATVGDITKVDEKDVPDCDVLVGGFPYIDAA